jgi:hypothetical protein
MIDNRQGFYCRKRSIQSSVKLGPANKTLPPLSLFRCRPIRIAAGLIKAADRGFWRVDHAAGVNALLQFFLKLRANT